MKRSWLLAPLSLFVLSSCSWYRDLERSLVEDDKKTATSNRGKPVPRAQYDQLLTKYEELTKKYEKLKENPGQASLVDELQNSQTENFARTSPNVETETVSLTPVDTTPVPASVSSDIEGQLSLYRRGMSLKTSNPGEATKIFQQLESQGTAPVSVRAKFQIGDLLLSKQQYDLALQVFEDIITKNSSSGMVVDALRNAVVCADKLGIANKRDQYASMLNDVFEAN